MTYRQIPTLRDLRAIIREDKTVNDYSWTRPGLQALAIQRFGVWQMGKNGRVSRFVFGRLYRFLHEFARNFYGIEIYATTTIGRRLRIAHQNGIVVHRHSTIGDDCLIRQGVSIGRGPNHGAGFNDAGPVLGDRVEVGANAVIIGGISIGDDVVIGPGAIVMTNVPANSIVVSPICKILPRPSMAATTETANSSAPTSPPDQREQ